jgi:spermidine synthase
MPEETTQPSENSATVWRLTALYAFSGLTSVAFEVLWARALSLQFGVSIFAVVLTVAAFMAGLGAGSLAAKQNLGRIKNPLRVLAALEGGIAVYALLLPFLLQATAGGIEGVASHLSLFGWYGLIAVAALCLLLLPAFAMGAGFPLLLAALGNQKHHLGRIYGINTLGAVLGALLPLFLLPLLGWANAERFVAVIGLLVAWQFYVIAGRPSAPDIQEAHLDIKPSNRLLLTYAGIGAASLVLEIAWTRLFGMVMMRTEYVLAVILAAFLLGIGLGSLAAHRLKRQEWFTILPMAAGGFSLVSLWLLAPLSAWVERAEFSSLFSALSLQGLTLILLTLPVTFMLGAWLPLLHGRCNGGGVWLYGANSLGAALGAVLSGLVLIPWLGSTGAVVVAAFALLVLGLAGTESKKNWLAVPVFLLAAFPVMKMPQISSLAPAAFAGSTNLFHYEDAVSMTHVVEQQDGQRLLLTDLQRMDASTEPTAVFVQSNQARLPLLLADAPRSVLFLGLGTGISVAGSLPFPNLQRTAVELSQGAILAADSLFAPANHDVMKQTSVVRDDARHFLSATGNKYDVIIGDVFHPDMVGMSSLLSVQEFKRARSRLTDNGVFVQWLALNQFDGESLGVILRSFKEAYPDAQMFLDGMHLALVGPQQKFMGAKTVLRNLARMSPGEQEAATAGEGAYTWLGRYWGPILVGEGEKQDEWAPVIEFRLPRARYAGDLNVSSVLRALLKARPDMKEAEAALGIEDRDRESFERAYGGAELMARGWLAATQGASGPSNRLTYLAFQANPKDRWIAYAMADSMLASLPQAKNRGIDEETALQEILRLNPQHVEALRLLWHIKREKKDKEADALRLRLLELSPLDSEVRKG